MILLYTLHSSSTAFHGVGMKPVSVSEVVVASPGVKKGYVIRCILKGGCELLAYHESEVHVPVVCLIVISTSSITLTSFLPISLLGITFVFLLLLLGTTRSYFFFASTLIGPVSLLTALVAGIIFL